MSTERFFSVFLAYIFFLPTAIFLLAVFFIPFDPIPHDFLFHVARSSFTDFNFTATTCIDGTNKFHYQYNLTLNITVRKLDNNHHFLHYDDVKVMAFYKHQRFAMVDLSSFYRGKELTNTTDLLSLTHSLKGDYDDLVTNPPLVDGPNLSDGHGGSASVTDDHMVAQFYYSMSLPRNIKWPYYKPIYSNGELEFKCELELKFPLMQHINASTLKTISCDPKVLAHSWKYYFYFVLLVPLYIFIMIFVAFLCWLSCFRLCDEPSTIHDDSIALEKIEISNPSSTVG